MESPGVGINIPNALHVPGHEGTIAEPPKSYASEGKEEAIPGAPPLLEDEVENTRPEKLPTHPLFIDKILSNADLIKLYDEMSPNNSTDENNKIVQRLRDATLQRTLQKLYLQDNAKFKNPDLTKRLLTLYKEGYRTKDDLKFELKKKIDRVDNVGNHLKEALNSGLINKSDRIAARIALNGQSRLAYYEKLAGHIEPFLKELTEKTAAPPTKAPPSTPVGKADPLETPIKPSNPVALLTEGLMKGVDKNYANITPSKLGFDVFSGIPEGSEWAEYHPAASFTKETGGAQFKGIKASKPGLIKPTKGVITSHPAPSIQTIDAAPKPGLIKPTIITKGVATSHAAPKETVYLGESVDVYDWGSSPVVQFIKAANNLVPDGPPSSVSLLPGPGEAGGKVVKIETGKTAGSPSHNLLPGPGEVGDKLVKIETGKIIGPEVPRTVKLKVKKVDQPPVQSTAGGIVRTGQKRQLDILAQEPTWSQFLHFPGQKKKKRRLISAMDATSWADIMELNRNAE